MEQWKDVPGYEGLYQVSSRGRVKSLARTVPYLKSQRHLEERIMKRNEAGDGVRFILQVNLRKNGKTLTYSIARLLLTAFVRPPLPGEEAQVLGDDHEYVTLGNVRWTTRQEINRDSGQRRILQQRVKTIMTIRQP